MAIGIILAIVFVIIGIIGIVIGIKKFADYEKTKGFISMGVSVVMIICFILIPFSFHTVDTGEIAVIKHLGEAKNVRTSGTYFDFWITNDYVYYDTKVQNVDISTAAYSSDAQPFTWHSLSVDIPATSLILFPQPASSSLAVSITFIPPDPVRSIMASNSALLRASAPFSSIFSRGLSSKLNSFIFISKTGHLSVPLGKDRCPVGIYLKIEAPGLQVFLFL